MTSEEFKQIRKSLNLTQKQLSELLYRTERQIITYESGNVNIPDLVVDKMMSLKKNLRP